MILYKISPGQIIRAHLGTLHRNRGVSVESRDEYISPEKWELVGFFLVPMIISAVAVFVLDTGIRGMEAQILTAFSIFGGLLLNLQVLILNLVRSGVKIVRSTPKESLARLVVLRQTYSNVAYSIVVSVGIVVMVIASKASAVPVRHALIKEPWSTFGFDISEFAVFTLMINFVLTLLMILRRIHGLFQKELEAMAAEEAAALNPAAGSPGAAG